MTAIDEYDLGHIFEESDVAREYAEILHDATDEYDESFCGVVKNTLTGSYWSFSAWHDYTGWDCRSGVSWFGPFESVMGAVSQLTQADRRLLGFEHAPEHKGLWSE